VIPGLIGSMDVLLSDFDCSATVGNGYGECFGGSSGGGDKGSLCWTTDFLTLILSV
jgi:hypothetical protein